MDTSNASNTNNNSNISSVVEAKLKEVHEENVRLNELITKCELKYHTQGLEVSVRNIERSTLYF